MSQYKIGQLAKVMGVSTHLLKHYEKFGLVTPVVDDSTNYRYYDIGQCSRIIESKKYRNIGFSLHDIVGLMNHDSNEEIEHKIEQQINSLEAQIKELETQKRMAEAYLNSSKEWDRKLNQWFIEYSPGYLFLKQTNDHELIEEGQCITEKCNFLDEVPFTKSAIYIYHDSIQEENLHYHWGLMKQVEQINVEEWCDECNIYIKPARCFVTYLALETPYMDNGYFISKIKEQFHQFSDCITQDIIAVRYKIVHQGIRQVHYFQVYIPLT